MRGTIVFACLVVGCSSLSGLSGDDDASALPDRDGGASASEAGAPSDGGGDGAMALETAETAADAIATALCARWVVCRPGQLTQFFGGPKSCTSDAADRRRVGFTAPGAHVPSTAAVHACADALAKQPCRDLVDDALPVECQFKGDRAEGASCIDGAQCQTALCVSTDPNGCGVCRVPGKIGDDCSSGVCARGLTCVGSRCAAFAGISEDCTTTPCSALYQCHQGMCVELLGDSATCGSDIPCNYYQGLGCRTDTMTCATETVVQPGTGTSCGPINNNAVICAAGYCKPNVPNPPVCTALARPGEACGMAPCARAYNCIAGQCALPSQSYCP